MDIEQAVAFLRANHRAVLHTFRSDGRPQLSPVLVAVSPAGKPIVSTRETAIKARNLDRDPRVSLCVFTDAFFGQWLQIDGTARLLRLPEAIQPLVEYYRAISGEHPDWDDYRAAMTRERRLIIEIDITRAGPDYHG